MDKKSTVVIKQEPLDKLNGTNFRDAKLKIGSNLASFSATWRTKSMFFLFGFGCSLFFIFIPVMELSTVSNLKDLWGKGFFIYMIILFLFIILLLFFISFCVKGVLFRFN